MKDFYTCPECQGTDFTWAKYPDIYCYTCHALHVVVALSFSELDDVLKEMDQRMKDNYRGVTYCPAPPPLYNRYKEYE